MMPKGAKLPRFSRLVLLVGEPIPAPPRTEAGRMPRSAIGGLTQQLHGELQRLFDEAQVLAGRPNEAPPGGQL
jgi:hypothetical protein